jgi:hypothetical protein
VARNLHVASDSLDACRKQRPLDHVYLMQRATALGFRVRNASRGAVLLALTAIGSSYGCAGSTASRQMELDRAFAEIQVHEASIERNRVVVARQAPNCPRSCEASASASGHEQQLCALARQLADADASSRCEQARRVARAIELRAASACGCRDAG